MRRASDCGRRRRIPPLKQSMPRRIVFTVLFLIAALPLRAAELRLEGPEIAKMVQTAFNGTVIRLNRDGIGPKGQPIPASFIQLGPAMQNVRFAFSMPEERYSLGFAGNAIYSVNDINSDANYVVKTARGPMKMGQTITVIAMPAAYLITLRFEDVGTEILGRPDGGLSRMRSSVVPNVEVNNISLQIALYPQTVGNSIAFKPSRVTFFGDIQAQGLANLTIAGHHVDIVDSMTDYKSRLKETIEREVAKLIDRSLPQLAANLQHEIIRRGAGLGVRVTAVRAEGTSIIIRGETAG